MIRAGLLLALALLVAVATVAVIAPAEWVAMALRSATHERLDLADAQGTAWHGSAVVVLRAGAESNAFRASLPGRLQWVLDPWPLFAGHLVLDLQHPSALAQALAIRAAPDGTVELSGDRAQLPASLLTGLGAPWNTIRPGGQLTLAWGGLTLLRWGMGGLRGQGEASVRWSNAASAMSSVAPFGDFQLDTNGRYPGTTMALRTLSGPLELKGDGTIDDAGRVRFRGSACPLASADEAAKAQLNGFISLLGRREGECAVLNIGS